MCDSKSNLCKKDYCKPNVCCNNICVQNECSTVCKKDFCKQDKCFQSECKQDECKKQYCKPNCCKPDLCNNTCFTPSRLNPYVKSKNTDIIVKNYKMIKETSSIFAKLAEIIEKHKMDLLQLVEVVKVRNVVDDGICNMLDNSVDLMLTNLQKYLDTPKCHPAGLGTQIIQPVPILSDPLNKTVLPPPINPDTLQYQLCSVLYGSLTFPNTLPCSLVGSVGLGSIAMNPSIEVYVSFNNKEVLIRYKFKNDGTQDLCFPILWSGNLIINPSSIVCLVEPAPANKQLYIDNLELKNVDGKEVTITVNEFIERVIREIKSLSALSGIFTAEFDRFYDQICRFKEQVEGLVPLCDSEIFNKCE